MVALEDSMVALEDFGYKYKCVVFKAGLSFLQPGTAPEVLNADPLLPSLPLSGDRPNAVKDRDYIVPIESQISRRRTLRGHTFWVSKGNDSPPLDPAAVVLHGGGKL